MSVSKVRYFDYAGQFKMYESKFNKIISDVLTRGAFILGSDTVKFENHLARFCGSKYAVGVGNCTDAILLSLYAAGIGPGDEVITVSHTFVATVEVIKFLGATPVFVDIDSDHNINVSNVEALITKKTKAIVPVHLNGKVCNNMDKLINIAKKHKIIIIEDAAQALGAKFKEKKAGTFGLAGCFSFYPAKLLGAFGDAGAIITDDRRVAERLKSLRNHGRTHGTAIGEWGLNCRIDNLQAAILDFKLSKIQDFITRRREIAALYYGGLYQVKELMLPQHSLNEKEYYHVYQNYEIEAEDRDRLVKYLKTNSIEVGLPWGGAAVHQFSGLGFSGKGLLRTEQLFRKVLMLPMYYGLSDKHINLVIKAIREFYGRG